MDRDIHSVDRSVAVTQSVRKAIALLRATAEHGDGASVSALARTAGLPRATALRLIQTMEGERLLQRVPAADRVVLGPELLRLARSVDPGAVLLGLAHEGLARLREEVRETVTFSVVGPDGGLDVVHQEDGPQHLVVRSWIGQRFPLHASSSGKVLLASYDDARLARFLRRPREALTPATITSAPALRRELDAVREQGFGASVDELEEGLASVSVGMRGDGRALVGVINVSGLSMRFDGAARAGAVERMRALAGDVEAALAPTAGASRRSPNTSSAARRTT
jgi:DNA-binding IclR family transcriptional regulator